MRAKALVAAAVTGGLLVGTYFLIPERPAFGPPKIGPEKAVHFENFAIELTAESPDATIRYTLDGSDPNDSSTKYQGPIKVDEMGIQVVRAASFGFKRQRSEIASSNFISMKGLNDQKRPANLPEKWTHGPADFDFTPPVGAMQIVNALSHMAVMEVHATQSAIFGAEGLVSTRKAGRVDGLVKLAIADGRYASSPGKLSLLQDPRELASDPKPSFDLQVEGSQIANFFGTPRPSTTSTFVLDAGRESKWTSTDAKKRLRTTFFETSAFDRLFESMGRLAPRGEDVHLFLGGLYWGVYSLRERPDAAFFVRRFGGTEKDYEVLTPADLEKGSIDALVADIKNASFTDIEKRLDVVALADFHVLATAFFDERFPKAGFVLARSNTYLPRWTIVPDGMELSYAESGLPTFSVTGAARAHGGKGLSALILALAERPEYKLIVADRIERQVTRGPLGGDVGSMLENMVSDVGLAFPMEASRWGDSTGSPINYYQWFGSVRREADLVPERVVRIRQTLAEFKQPLDPPIWFGTDLVRVGEIPKLWNPNPRGTLFARIDGLDPRMPDGSLRPGSTPYAFPELPPEPAEEPEPEIEPGDPRMYDGVRAPTARPPPEPSEGVRPTASGILIARVFDKSTNAWSAAIRAPLEVPEGPRVLVISEIHSFAPREEQFVELWNVGPNALELKGMRIMDAVLPSYELESGQRVAIVFDANAFRPKHPGARTLEFPVAIPASGLFNLYSRNGANLVTLNAGEKRPAWLPPGHSLLPNYADLVQVATWKPSKVAGGSPGEADPNEPPMPSDAEVAEDVEPVPTSTTPPSEEE